MRVRRIAVLIDGGFYLKRLPKLVPPRLCTTPRQAAHTARYLCKCHVLRLTGASRKSDFRWLDHVYRLFYYDAEPYGGVSHHPVLNRPIEFANTDAARFRLELFAELRRQRKFALRLGEVVKEDGWRLPSRFTRRLLRLAKWMEQIGEGPIDASLLRELKKIRASWQGISEHDVTLGLRQKGVDMRIGLDIATMTLKRQVDTIVLVTGDSDFVSAAKLARREGVEFLLDPLWQRVRDQLSEHVDGVASVFPKPTLPDCSLIAA